jgi:hypothetical protein
MATRVLLVSAIMVVAVAPCPAQVSSQGTVTKGGSFSGSATFGPGPRFALPVVTGAPYSGEEVNESLKILTDGTRITQKQPMGRKVWRDDHGRTRSERPFAMGPRQALPVPVIVEINDPVAGYKYTLDPQEKVAHRQALPAPGSRPTGFVGGSVGSGPSGGIFSAQLPAGGGGGGGRAGAMVPASTPSPANAPMQPRFSHESLGTQSIDGVIAEGTRNTTTYPVGMMGNDREFSVVSESWMSPDLKIQILSKSNDPRNGESTFRIQDLSRTLPDAGLFTVPPDYTVVDEAGAFTINFKGQ